MMTKEQKCISELYSLLERIEHEARRHDLTLLRVPRGATGCDMFQWLPPISRIMSDITDRYDDVINEAFKSEICKRCHGKGTEETPVTNADRIRAMSDEELADFIGSLRVCNICHRRMNSCFPQDDLDWLQQPAKEDDNA